MNKMSPIHPGEILGNELKEMALSASALAKLLKVPTNRITAILHEKRAITADTAVRLAHFFGNTPEFWMNLQIAYDIKLVLEKNGKKIKQEIVFHRAV